MSGLSVRELACVRGGRELFSGLTFSVSAGEVAQIEGANGAGKTTLMRTLCGLSQFESGEIAWNEISIGENPEAWHASMAYVGHAHAVKSELSVVENLRVFSRLSAVRQGITLADAVERVGLAGYDDELCKTLSAGQRRRAGLARLVIADVTIWVLDEPYTALDVKGVAIVNALIADHAARGGSVILSSHQAVSIDGVDVSRIALGGVR